MMQELLKLGKKVYALTPDELDKRIIEIRAEIKLLEEFNQNNFDLNMEAYMIIHRMMELGKEIKPLS